MPSPSNIYADKVYSEHPLALWSLDDKVDYLSLISESQREISEPSWYVDGVSNYYEDVMDTQPFKDSILNVLEGTPNSIITLKTPNLVTLRSLQEVLGTMCIGTYYYSNSDNYEYVEIGYEYVDTETSLVVENIKRFTSSIRDKWVFISNTFDIPNEDNPFKVIIRIKLNNAGSTPSDYIFNLNGLSVGQWSEEFNTTSLGSNAIDLPSNIGIGISDVKCIESNSYGSLINKGYYIVSDNVLTAKNTSIPLVYGSSGVIRLLPNYRTQIDSVIDGGPVDPEASEIIDGGLPTTDSAVGLDGGTMFPVPSYIIPGLGMFNESGRYKDYTLEFWARIDCNSFLSHRIVGPVGSKDGLYVEGGHLTLVVGNTFKSYFIGQWIRPMLIQITIGKDSAGVILNGEEIISMQIDLSSITFASLLDIDEKDQDFIGFYSYPQVPSFEIDSVAIYSYKVPVIVAKRRFVYGQGVGSSELINNSYAGNEVVIDYTFSEYATDYTYPDFALWNQGFFDNLTTNNLSLSTPEYNLPTLYFNNKTEKEFFDDCLGAQNEIDQFITLRPNSTWDNTNAYLHFPRIDVLQTPVKMIYSVFQFNSSYNEDQTILKIYNNTNSNYFKIAKVGLNLEYIFNFNNIETILNSEVISYAQKYVVGIKIDELAAQNNNIYSFFNNASNLKMYVGGDETGETVFGGKIYNVGFGSNYSASTFLHFIDGIVDSTQHHYFLNKLTSYTLLPTKKYGSFFLDIGVSSYWEDYMPLSYFAKYVTDEYGKEYYHLDFLQFNIDYPSPSVPVLGETTSEWIYSELDTEFDTPIQKTYYQLDNENYTGWQNYEDMNQKADKYKQYDISSHDVKSYMTMQYILDGANLLPNNFTTTIPVSENKVIDLSNHPDWRTHKFELIDGTVIYPPNDEDFNNLAIVYRLEFNTRNTVNKPTSIKQLQLSSQAFDHNKFNKVGTKFGTYLYPYVKSGIYYDHRSKNKNPFAIYKNSTPYLYMTQNSGIEIRNEYEASIDKGLSIPINAGQTDNFKISALQFWMRSNKYNFPATRQKLFELNYQGDTIEFFIEANSSIGNRGKIYAISRLSQKLFTELTYYVNGNFVREPVVSTKEWSAIGITFDTNLNFDNFLGSMNITGPYTFNNIAFYQATNLQLAQSRILQSWSKIKNLDGIPQDWENWLSYTWNQMLVIGTSDLYGTNPSDIYKTYIGTNKIIMDDSEGLMVDSDAIKVYQDSTWQSYVTTPV